jgi:hypothetical protein
MSKILGYGEDALTLWALKEQLRKILDVFKDSTNVEDCLIFYRPSFGRSGGKHSAEFGEFDAIVASKEKYYLIESKWDNHSNYEKDSVRLRDEQVLRHEIFTWYLYNWGTMYSGNWQRFKAEQEKNFNTLSKIVNYCDCDTIQSNARNVLLFFYDSSKSQPPTKTNGMFTIIPIDYAKYTQNNFINI